MRMLLHVPALITVIITRGLSRSLHVARAPFGRMFGSRTQTIACSHGSASVITRSGYHDGSFASVINRGISRPSTSRAWYIYIYTHVWYSLNFLSIGIRSSYSVGACRMMPAVPANTANVNIHKNSRSRTIATYFQSSFTCGRAQVRYCKILRNHASPLIRRVFTPPKDI